MTPVRRRIGLAVLAVLVVVHLALFALYVARDRQSHLLGLYLDARDQWREGHLDVAAAEYAAFNAARPSVAWPVVLFRNFPSAAAGWFSAGRVEVERHHVDAALAAFQRSMALEPGRGRREFRDLLLESGRPEDLLAFAAAEDARHGASVQGEKDAAAALLALGRPAEAATHYRRALALLPALLARIDPGAPPGLSAEEADLMNLLSVALGAAGDSDGATAACGEIARRLAGHARLDRLCRAAELAAAGDAAGARALLAGYAPPAPEHNALAHALAP